MLGVSKDADLKQIKQAFKRKALKLHPDVNTAVRRTLCTGWLEKHVPSHLFKLAAQVQCSWLMKNYFIAAGCKGAIHGMQARISGPLRHQAEKPL